MNKKKTNNRDYWLRGVVRSPKSIQSRKVRKVPTCPSGQTMMRSTLCPLFLPLEKMGSWVSPMSILSPWSLSGFSGKLLAWNPRSWPSHAALLFRRVFVSFQAGGGMTAGDLKSDLWLLYGVLRSAAMSSYLRTFVAFLRLVA